MEQPVFSSDRDVSPEGEPLNTVQSGCLVLIASKIGCLLVLLALFIFVGILAKFID